MESTSRNKDTVQVFVVSSVLRYREPEENGHFTAMMVYSSPISHLDTINIIQSNKQSPSRSQW